MLADKAIDNFRPHYPVLVLCRAGLSIVAMSLRVLRLHRVAAR